MMRRRSFLLGAGILLAAPSIVRATSLMPIKKPRSSHMITDGTSTYGMSDAVEVGETIRLEGLVGFPNRTFRAVSVSGGIIRIKEVP